MVDICFAIDNAFLVLNEVPINFGTNSAKCALFAESSNSLLSFYIILLCIAFLYKGFSLYQHTVQCYFSSLLLFDYCYLISSIAFLPKLHALITDISSIWYSAISTPFCCGYRVSASHYPQNRVDVFLGSLLIQCCVTFHLVSLVNLNLFLKTDIATSATSSIFLVPENSMNIPKN